MLDSFQIYKRLKRCKLWNIICLTDYLGETDSTKKKKLNKGKVLRISIILIIAIFVISFVILYENNDKVREFFDVYIFRKVIDEEKVSSIEIDALKDINVFAHSNKEHSIDIEISNPIFESNGDYLCIAEKEGQKLYLIYNKNIIWESEVEGNIDSINVNKKGYVSVIISGTSYKTVVQTFDSKGKELFKNYLSRTNVIDTDISNDNKYLAIAEANFSGIVVQSNIKIISIEDAKNNSDESIKYTHLAKANDLIINIEYNSKNDLVCMYDEHIDVLKGEENIELLNLKNEEILFADINIEPNIVKIVKKSDNLLNSNVEMQIINSNNINDVNIYKIDNTPRKIYTQDNMVAVNLGTSAMFINSNGWLVKKYESNKKEIQDIVVSNEIAGIISKDKIYIISL